MAEVSGRLQHAINAHRRLIGAENALDIARRHLTKATEGLSPQEIEEYMKITEKQLAASGRGPERKEALNDATGTF